MVVFFDFFQELLFALFGLILDLLAFLLSSGLLGLDLGGDFCHHFLVPLDFLVRVLAAILDEPRLLDEVQVFLQQDVDFVVGQMLELCDDLIDFLSEFIEVFSGLAEEALEFGEVFAGGDLFADFLLGSVVFFEVFERLFEEEVETFGLKVHFFADCAGVLFVSFFVIGDFA